MEDRCVVQDQGRRRSESPEGGLVQDSDFLKWKYSGWHHIRHMCISVPELNKITLGNKRSLQRLDDAIAQESIIMEKLTPRRSNILKKQTNLYNNPTQPRIGHGPSYLPAPVLAVSARNAIASQKCLATVSTPNWKGGKPSFKFLHQRAYGCSLRC